MVPFMYYDLKVIVYQLLEIIVKPAVLDSFKAKPQTWKDIDLSKDNNLISARKLDLGFAVDEDIGNFKKNQQMPMKRSQNLGVKRNVLLLPWYPSCSKEALLDQHC